jgi:type VI protein secretion system component VasF
LRHALGATEAERARLERDVASARADRERVEAELAALRTPAAARTSPAIEGTTRLGTPRSGTALWVVRLVALALVVALFAAVAVLVAGVL